MKTHARLITYGDTAADERDHPLVLVVGREASRDAMLVDGVGTYDFDTVRSRFWTTAYSAIASAARTDLWALRESCRARGASPIVFADALPVGIDHRNPDKLARRDAVTREQLDAHLEALFAMPILERVSMVVCAGHREGTRGSPAVEALFARAFDTLAAGAAGLGAQVVETPAMLPFNTPVIRRRLVAAERVGGGRLRTVLETFDRAPPLARRDAA